MPQFEATYAPAKPRIPIHAIARRSARDSGRAACPRESSTRARAARPSRRKASIAGGTLSSVTLATTYDVP